MFEIRADLKVEPEVARVVEVALARFGRIDVLVNAVGGFDGRAELLGGALSRAAELFTLNALVPTAVAVRIALDFWRHHDRDNASRNRVVVNLSATAGVDAADPSAGGAFGATKAAQNMLSMHLAEELRPFNVRVVTVAPAPVPQVVTLARVTSAIAALIEGHGVGEAAANGFQTGCGGGDQVVNNAQAELSLNEDAAGNEKIGVFGDRTGQ